MPAARRPGNTRILHLRSENQFPWNGSSYDPFEEMKFIISMKNLTVVGFDKLHIGAAILDFSLLQLLSNQTAQILPKLIFDLQYCSQQIANRCNSTTNTVKREV